VREDHFNYDALGNRRSWNHVGWRSWLYFARRDNGLNQYVSWSPSTIYYDDNYPGYGFPGNGNLMAEGWITASYNALNQPVAIWSPNMPSGAFTWFGYDPLGRCVKRWVGPSGGETSNPATYMYYDGWNLIQEGNSASAVTRLYVHGNRIDEIPVTFNVSTSEYGFHHYDARGDCALLTDIGGNIREQYYYDAFGKPYIYNASGGTYYGDVSPFGNRFLFTGREWLQDLKLYDYRHRLYQPELGRFLQPDPKHFEAGDYNLYRYCHNDPINKSDPTGLYVSGLTSFGGGEWIRGMNGITNRELDLMKSVRSFDSWQDAGRAAGRAHAARAHREKREYHGELLQSLSNARVYDYGAGVPGTVNGMTNESELGTGPVPSGFKSVGIWWVLVHHQDTKSWPVNPRTGESDGQVLRRAHTNGVLTIPPAPGSGFATNHFDYKVYNAETDRDE
jgi:RHS repeat-associated protein